MLIVILLSLLLASCGFNVSFDDLNPSSNSQVVQTNSVAGTLAGKIQINNVNCSPTYQIGKSFQEIFRVLGSGDIILKSSNPNAGTYNVPVEINCGGVTDTTIIRIIVQQAVRSIRVKALLAGPYNSATPGLMNDSLRLAPSFPLTSPYSDALTIDGNVLNVTGNNAIVDWVFIQLRNPNDRNEILEEQSGLLQKDGDIVSIDGSTPIGFAIEESLFFVVVGHRNHLDIVTSNPVSVEDSAPEIDLRNNRSLIENGIIAVDDVGDGFFAMVAGDVSENGQILLTDRSQVQSDIGRGGYLPTDLNLNGQVQNSDRFIIDPNIGRGVQF